MRITLASDPGTPGWPNEDFAAVAPGAAVLLDGATTSPRGADTGCVHGVAWYARTLGTTFLAAITGEPHVPLSKALADAIGDGRAPVIITDTHPAASAAPGAAMMARTGTFPRAGLRGIALLSDGAARIADQYGLMSWPAVVGAIRDHGPAELVRQVRAAEASDPDGRRWPRGKSQDDATIVYWPQG